MKEIKLKILGKGTKEQLDYKTLIKTIAQTPGNAQAGLSLDEVRKGVRILEALEKATDILKLEDEDYKLLCEKLETFKFGLAHKNIIEFADDIKKKEVD